MKSKNRKIKNIVWILEIAFSCCILIFLFVSQILLLDKYYEVYKTRILNEIADNIQSSKEIDTEYLSGIAFEKGICVAIYKNSEFKIISNVFNKGCAVEKDSSLQDNYIKSFIASGKSEDTLILKNPRFKNKALVKAVNIENQTYIFLTSSIEALDSSVMLLKSQYIYIQNQ